FGRRQQLEPLCPLGSYKEIIGQFSSIFKGNFRYICGFLLLSERSDAEVEFAELRGVLCDISDTEDAIFDRFVCCTEMSLWNIVCDMKASFVTCRLCES